MDYISKHDYENFVASTREKRIKWFKEARYGMFIHYGLYSQLGTGEWSQANENYTAAEYENLSATFKPKENCCDEWCALAKAAGARYAVLTTRHHEGFSLWNSKVNPYNSYNACGRDLVREFVDACRKYDLRIGLYSSLMDWHHPDSWRCANDPEARARFTKYIEDLNVELLSNYGKIDILWYDVSCPITSAEGWDSINRNYRLRRLQPDIIINNRSMLDEDFGTPEGYIAADGKHYFESCMTLTNLAWGYVDADQAHDFMMTKKQLLRNLHLCTCKGGNLLINVSPDGNGSVAADTRELLETTGRWLSENGEAVYGEKYPTAPIYSANTLTAVSADADLKTFYLWNWVWPKNGTLRIGGYMDAPKKISYLNGGEIDFEVDGHRIILHGLPKKAPDEICGVTVLKMEFDAPPRHHFRSYYPQICGGNDYSEGNHKW